MSWRKAFRQGSIRFARGSRRSSQASIAAVPILREPDRSGAMRRQQAGNRPSSNTSSRKRGARAATVQGFFQLFNAQSAQCGPITHQIQRMRTNLQQITTNLERLRAGNGASPERDSQRRSVLIALAQNNCGPQYAAAARNQGSFFDNLFGNHSDNQTILPPVDSGAQSGTYRTVCVRSCDGFYFPISFATTPSRFPDDERTCKNLCPAADAALYAYRNPGEDMNQAVSTSGQPYSSSPNAFRYRQEFNPSCSCKAAGQTWAEALKGTRRQGDGRPAGRHHRHGRRRAEDLTADQRQKFAKEKLGGESRCTPDQPRGYCADRLHTLEQADPVGGANVHTRALERDENWMAVCHLRWRGPSGRGHTLISAVIPRRLPPKPSPTARRDSHPVPAMVYRNRETGW